MKFDPDLKSVPVVFLTALVSPQETTAGGAMIAGQFFFAKEVRAREGSRASRY